MIQNGTYLNIVDNSGGQIGFCIKVLKGYKQRYATIGNLITISVKSLRSKRKKTAKIKKGGTCRGLVLRIKQISNTFNGDNFQFFENSIILLNKQNKFLGTRIFGCVPRKFRYTKYMKIISMSLGILL